MEDGSSIPNPRLNPQHSKAVSELSFVGRSCHAAHLRNSTVEGLPMFRRGFYSNYSSRRLTRPSFGNPQSIDMSTNVQSHHLQQFSRPKGKHQCTLHKSYLSVQENPVGPELVGPTSALPLPIRVFNVELCTLVTALSLEDDSRLVLREIEWCEEKAG